MAIVLSDNQYGKAETRVVRICRDTERHEIRDLNVSTALRGDFAAAHLTGDQANVLPTDSQKNTCFAYAKERGVGQIEDYALALASHFVTDIAPVTRARVDVDEYRWERVAVAGAEHAHTFVRAGHEVRSAAVTTDTEGTVKESWVISGVKDLVVLKSTGSQFTGFLTDRYTTLAEASDRILATSLTARWRYAGTDVAWDEAFGQVREIRLSAPNKHHFLVDLAPFGLENPGEVFHADDRPYGLIQCAAMREGAPDARPAWDAP